MENINNLPILNSKYDYERYHGEMGDGEKKVVTIVGIIPFGEIDEKTLSDWKKEVDNCDWLYAKETDYFLKGKLEIGENEIEDVVFVRISGGGWFSMGEWAGRLDLGITSILNFNGAKYSRKEFDGFTHRFMIEFEVGEPYSSSSTLYSNSDSYQKLEDFIKEKKSDKVISFKIIHRASKEQDEMTYKFIDETLNNI